MIQYVTGDVTTPIGRGKKIIAHVTNNQGGWGRGLVLQISRKWSEPERRYRTNPIERRLGVNQYIQVEDDVWVANMCAQHGYTSRDRPALDYEALDMCLSGLAAYSRIHKLSVHCPHIGCGLGGGDWPTVENLIKTNLDGLSVMIYDL